MSCYVIHQSGEVREWPNRLDWKSSDSVKGVRGFDSHPLRHYQIPDNGETEPLKKELIAKRLIDIE